MHWTRSQSWLFIAASNLSGNRCKSRTNDLGLPSKHLFQKIHHFYYAWLSVAWKFKGVRNVSCSQHGCSTVNLIFLSALNFKSPGFDSFVTDFWSTSITFLLNILTFPVWSLWLSHNCTVKPTFHNASLKFKSSNVSADTSNFNVSIKCKEGKIGRTLHFYLTWICRIAHGTGNICRYICDLSDENEAQHSLHRASSSYPCFFWQSLRRSSLYSRCFHIQELFSLNQVVCSNTRLINSNSTPLWFDSINISSLDILAPCAVSSETKNRLCCNCTAPSFSFIRFGVAPNVFSNGEYDYLISRP